MTRTRNSVAGLAISIVGAAAYLLSPIAAAVLTFIGTYIACTGMWALNVPWTRGVYAAACISHSLVLYIASGSALLGGIALLSNAVLIVSPTLVRTFGYHASWQVPAAIPAVLLLTALAWPTGPWGWALLPSVLHLARVSRDIFGQIKRRRAHHREEWRIKIGEPVPDFELKTRDGKTTFRLKDERGQYILLCFLRSDWCPLCHVQMRIYKIEAKRLAERNVKLVAISPASGPEAESFSQMMSVDYLLLVDPDCHVADVFGAKQMNLPAGKQAPLPVSFLIDPEGKLCYSTRPDHIGDFLDPRKVAEMLETAAPLQSAAS